MVAGVERNSSNNFIDEENKGNFVYGSDVNACTYYFLFSFHAKKQKVKKMSGDKKKFARTAIFNLSA
jgi:ribosome biogenesis protein Nip4